MATMNISLPDEMKAFVDGRLAGGQYSTVSDYVRDLIRRDREERQIEAKLLEALKGSPSQPVTEETRRRIEQVGLERLAALKPK
jgi:antitoxin ParD1/3/4